MKTENTHVTAERSIRAICFGRRQPFLQRTLTATIFRKLFRRPIGPQVRESLGQSDIINHVVFLFFFFRLQGKIKTSKHDTSLIRDSPPLFFILTEK